MPVVSDSVESWLVSAVCIVAEQDACSAKVRDVMIGIVDQNINLD